MIRVRLDSSHPSVAEGNEKTDRRGSDNENDPDPFRLPRLGAACKARVTLGPPPTMPSGDLQEAVGASAAPGR
jgi:hypothetical protein